MTVPTDPNDDLPREAEHAPLPVEWLEVVDRLALDGAGSLDSCGLPQVDAAGDVASWAALLDRAPTAEESTRLSRTVRMARTLTSLERMSVPAELEGRVVASLQDGHRQDRAAMLVRSLRVRTAPGALDELVEQHLNERAPGSEESVRAPGVLGRLVEERLADPEAAITKDMTRRLDRQPAPEELTGRVESVAQAKTPAGSDVGSPIQRGWIARSAPMRWGMAAAAAVLLVVGLGLQDRGPRDVGSRGGVDDVSSPAGSMGGERVAAAKDLRAMAANADGSFTTLSGASTFTVRRLDAAEIKALSPGAKRMVSSMTGEIIGGRS